MSRWSPILRCIICSAGTIYSQSPALPDALLAEADRLATLRAWTRAEPLFAKAQALCAERGDERNALYAEVSKLRGQLPRNSVAEMSQRFAEFLDHPIVKSDDRLRLRCLIVKGETDLDFDPNVAEQTWTAAKELARKVGDSMWENRAEGELAIVAAIQGRTSETIQRLGDAIKRAEQLGDTPSEVRWITVFGQGFTRFKMIDQALAFFDKAIEKARTVPEIEFPLMTYVGKAEALMSTKRFAEAKSLLNQALAVAREKGAFGYQAELTRQLAVIARAENDTPTALKLLLNAAELARKAGGERILLEVAIDLANAQQTAGDQVGAGATLVEAVTTGRRLGDRFLLPRLLKQLADVRARENRPDDASDLLDEAADLIEGLLAHAAGPWVKEKLIGSMDDVFTARIHLEGATRNRPERLFEIIEQARGRVLADMLLNRPVADIAKRPELKAAEQRLAALQVKLLRARDRKQRRSLLNEIFATEISFGPGSAELFAATQNGSPREPLPLTKVQQSLHADEVLLLYALAERESFCVAVTKTAAKTHRLPGKKDIEPLIDALLDRIRQGKDLADLPVKLGADLVRIPEVRSAKRLIIVADGAIHRLPFDLLIGPTGQPFLETHAIQKVPSATVLAVRRLRERQASAPRPVLAISASGAAMPAAPIGQVGRGVYDLVGSELPPLPSANDEVRSVASAIGGPTAKTLIGYAATESKLKAEPLNQYRVLHFATHGLTSTKFPERSAVMLRAEPGSNEDGILQAREIIELRLNASLVTLSACETGTGAVHGQEGVSNLVRPFLAAGARSVVANLWIADDTFSLALMKEFYRGLSTGRDVATALQQAKRQVLKQFGSEATPKLWAGLEVHGDGRETITKP